VLPGKKYLPEDILRIAWRRKWLIVLPFVVVSTITALVAWRLPDTYRSDTLILVVPQRVPESYVKSTVTTRIEDRLGAIQQQILSRTRLERIIQDLNLYQRERRIGIMEDVVDTMRNRDIEVQIVKGDAFRVSYKSSDPRTAMKVADQLASAFMMESLSDRSVLAEQTTSFLQTQLDDARGRLETHEKKLADYKTKHSGELPSERDANIQVLNNLQLQVQALNDSMNRDKERRYQLDKTINDLSDVQAVPANVTISGDDPTSVAGGTVAAQLEAAKGQLRLLELRYKPDHPDVGRMKRVIRDLEAKQQAESLQQPLSPTPGGRPATPEEAVRQNRLKAAQADLEAVDRQVAQKQADEKRLRATMAGYQARIEATAGRESEMTSLTRDYETLRKTYDGLLAKQEDSKVSANLERRQIGEQFRTLDAARVPEKPISPNRPMINLIGALAGLGLGVGLVALLEYRDSSFRTDDEVASVLALPVVAVIPLMLSRIERKTLRRRTLVIGSATAVVVMGALAVAAWFVWRYQF
jgi:polysaccharide chain length determinant protein (PEP-CTERM system associated)